jgi:hypothetical protein
LLTIIRLPLVPAERADNSAKVARKPLMELIEIELRGQGLRGVKRLDQEQPYPPPMAAY